MDCILGYHLNPMRCGVAKFNQLLARRLGVPVFGLFDEAALERAAPLISMKVEEMTAEDLAHFEHRLDLLARDRAYRVYLHSFTGSALERRLVALAARVYCGNAELATALRDLRPDVEELWAPGMIDGRRRFNNAELSVFSFGMAHKVRTEKYRRLQQLLEATGRTYCLYISTALHESSTFDDEFGSAFQELQAIFGDRAHFLGYLSDSAVYNYLLDCTYFAAFFDRGLRGNNTSVNAAMEIGSVVITNLDAFSPTCFVHGENVLDIDRADILPTDPLELERIRARARLVGVRSLGWDAFTARLEVLEAGEPARRRESWLTTSSR